MQMKTKLIVSITSLTALITLMMVACSAATSDSTIERETTLPSATSSTDAHNLETFSDPFTYCAAVGQVDAPDARYSGKLMTDAFFKDYLKSAGLDPNMAYPDAFKKMTIWRCMDKKVYACNFGANIPCDSKADINKSSTQAMIDFCRQFPDSTFIPMSVTGHSVIYSWHCVKDSPEILGQLDSVDAAGYQSKNWQLVEPVP
jgi:hypothetical protein